MAIEENTIQITNRLTTDKMGGDKGEVIVVSACLVGLPTRYDGREKPSCSCLHRLKGKIWAPVCPEQLGGLSTPRQPADLINGDGEEVLIGRARVMDRDNQDVSENFIRGAKQFLRIVQSLPVRTVFLKARSPSCGISGKKGVTAALLAQHGYEICEFD
jgi:uncharacterized protein YbbK (DUF523 family)